MTTEHDFDEQASEHVDDIDVYECDECVEVFEDFVGARDHVKQEHRKLLEEELE